MGSPHRHRPDRRVRVVLRNDGAPFAVEVALCACGAMVEERRLVGEEEWAAAQVGEPVGAYPDVAR